MVSALRMPALLLVVSFVMGLTIPAYADSFFDVSKEKVYIEPTQDTAVVYIVRPWRQGTAVRLWAFADDQTLGVTRGKMYIVAAVTPGKHVFWAKAENVSALELEVEAGKTYYLRQQAQMGFFRARVVLSEMSEEKALKAIKKCKYSKLTTAGEARGAEIVAEKNDVSVKKAEKKTKKKERKEPK